MKHFLLFLFASLFPACLFAGTDAEAAASPWGDKAPQPIYSFDGYANNENVKYLYFSGDLLWELNQKNSPFKIGSWDIRNILGDLKGLLVMGSNKKSVIKRMQRDINALESSKKFETLAHDSSIRIYGHHISGLNNKYDEVVVFMEMEGTQTIIQLFGRNNGISARAFRELLPAKL